MLCLKSMLKSIQKDVCKPVHISVRDCRSGYRDEHEVVDSLVI